MPLIKLLPGDIVLYLWNRNIEKGPINPLHCIWNTYRLIDSAQKWTGHLANDVMHIGIVIGVQSNKKINTTVYDPNIYTEYLIAHSTFGRGVSVTALENDHPIIVLRSTNPILADQIGYTAKMFCLEKRVGEIQKSYLSMFFDLFSNIKTNKKNEIEDPLIFYSTLKAFLSLFVPMFYNIAPSVESIEREVDDLVFGNREISWHCSEFVVKILQLAASLVGLDQMHTANTTHIISPHDLAEHLLKNTNYKIVKPKMADTNIFMFTRDNQGKTTVQYQSKTIEKKRKEREDESIVSVHSMELRSAKRAKVR